MRGTMHVAIKMSNIRTYGTKPMELKPFQILYANSTDNLLGGALTLRNGRIDKYQFEEGYCKARKAGDKDYFTFYYYNQDHLGNNREVVDAKGGIYQTTNYYAFGTPYEDSTPSQYKYNGKELDRMHGLDTYDYGARQYDPILVRWDRMDPLCEKYYNVSPYAYCVNNPVNTIDPDGKKGVLVHGTWSDHTTWEHPNDIKAATKKIFNDGDIFKEYFDWSGDNTKEARTDGALKLIGYVQKRILSGELKDNDPITFIAHSHGGNVCIEAVNMMVEMDQFKGRQINLLTINTPVRDDYQLSENAQQRVNHVNVYNPKDPVQANGGSSLLGEIGPAGRTFPNAKNIEVSNPQGIIGVRWVQGYDGNSHSATNYPVLKFNWTDDFHNSHNQVNTWINKTK